MICSPVYSINEFKMKPLIFIFKTLFCFKNNFPLLVAVFKDLVKIHRSLTQDISDSIINKNDQNLYQIFISYKER